MRPTPIKPPRPTTPARAAAARANGAKSLGPATAQGKANSSRNSLRHGLRSRAIFPDHRTDPAWPAFLAAFEDEIQPQSPIEHELAETLALCHWRQRYLWNLERSILEKEFHRIAPLHADEDSATILALGNLADHTCVLDRLHRIDSALSKRHFQAIDRLIALRTAVRRPTNPQTTPAERRFGSPTSVEKMNFAEPEKSLKTQSRARIQPRKKPRSEPNSPPKRSHPHLNRKPNRSRPRRTRPPL